MRAVVQERCCRSGVRRETGDLAGQPAALALQARERGLERGVLTLEAAAPHLQAGVPGLDALLEAGYRSGVPVDRGGEGAVQGVARPLRDRGDARGPAVLCWGRAAGERGRGTGRVGGVRLLEGGGVVDEL